MVSRLCALAVAAALATACSDDSKPPVDGKPPLADRTVGREGTIAADQGLTCTQEGQKICWGGLVKVATCQGGKWVVTADCTAVKDSKGGACTCSTTLGGICQSGGQECH
jgi:hypothetical protein